MNKNKDEIKIKSIELTNYRFFYDKDEVNNKFDFDGKNILIYGENGSGKSSLYKAIELLTKSKIEKNYFAKEKNIFSETNPNVNFTFTNDRELTFDVDSEDLQTFEQRKPDFINKLSIFKPMLDYKKLLNIHYSSTEINQVNIYNMIKETLKDYPIEYNSQKIKIFDISSPTDRLKELENVLNNVLLSDINELISFFDVNYVEDKIFVPEFKINKFETGIKYSETEDDRLENFVNMYIDFKDNPITSYHSFLNEAKLSALAISIYFACIKSLFSIIQKDSIKILVLDDLLISLDMSNRLKLINILKKEFSDFQIIFFTHDKELFELYKDKLDWKAFELYYDNFNGISKCKKKESLSLIQKANKLFDEKDYELCGVILRKELERILNRYLKPQSNMVLYDLIEIAKNLTPNNEKLVLGNILTHTKHILNPSSHNDNRAIYSEELKEAIRDLNSIRLLENIEIKKILDKETQIKISLKKDLKDIIYFGAIKRDLFFSKEYKLMDCSCKITSNKENNTSLKGEKYDSLLSLYKAICKHELIDEEENYSTIIYFKDKLENWINISDLIK